MYFSRCSTTPTVARQKEMFMSQAGSRMTVLARNSSNVIGPDPT
jgi:hypothetical protein